MSENYDEDLMILEDEEGNEITVRVIDYFFYQGTEYAIMAEEDQDDDTDEITCFVMEIRPYTDENGEEMEEFLQVEDADLEAKLLEVANTKLNEDEESDEE